MNILPFKEPPPASPPTVEIELRPIPTSPGRFSAVRLDTGEVVVRSSRQPLLDGARQLAAEGMPDDVILAAHHAGSTIVAMRGQIGELRRWTIHESDRSGLRRQPWQPFQGIGADSPAAPAHKPQDGRQAITCLSVAREARRAPRAPRRGVARPSRRLAA